MLLKNDLHIFVMKWICISKLQSLIIINNFINKYLCNVVQKLSNKDRNINRNNFSKLN